MRTRVSQSLAYLGLIVVLVAITIAVPLWAIATALPVLVEAILVHARVLLLLVEMAQPATFL